MNAQWVTGERWAVLTHAVTGRNGVIKLLVKKLMQVLGRELARVNADLLQNLNRQRMHRRWGIPRTINLNLVACQMPRNGLSQL